MLFFAPKCVVCGEAASVEKVRCARCDIEMVGDFRLPRLSLLSVESAKIAEQFLLCDGSIKKLCGRLGLSYPTVRKRVTAMIKELRTTSPSSSPSRPS